MDELQADLSANEPLLDIKFIGVNWAGLESANSQATDSKSLPWLQDVDGDGDHASDAWADWGAQHLDLIVLDGDNEPLAKSNLIGAGLDQPENYAALREELVDMAMQSQKPWQNSDDPLDVDGDGIVIPRDVLIVVNRLNTLGPGKLPPPGIPQSPFMFFDVNADGDLSSPDALQVVSFLNAQSTADSGEGELGLGEASEIQDQVLYAVTDAAPTTSTESQVPSRNDSSSDSSTGEEYRPKSAGDQAKRDATDLDLPSKLADGTGSYRHESDELDSFEGRTLLVGVELNLGSSSSQRTHGLTG